MAGESRALRHQSGPLQFEEGQRCRQRPPQAPWIVEWIPRAPQAVSTMRSARDVPRGNRRQPRPAPGSGRKSQYKLPPHPQATSSAGGFRAARQRAALAESISPPPWPRAHHPATRRRGPRILAQLRLTKLLPVLEFRFEPEIPPIPAAVSGASPKRQLRKHPFGTKLPPEIVAVARWVIFLEAAGHAKPAPPGFAPAA